MQRRGLAVVMLGAGLMLFACAGPQSSGGVSGSTPGDGAADPNGVVSTTVPPDAGGAPPAPPSEPPSALVSEARTALAEQIGVDAGTLTSVSSEQQTWDESLGCPLPNRAYAEIGVFGYLLRFEAAGTTYSVHSDQLGRTMIWCNNGTPRLIRGDKLPGER